MQGSDGGESSLARFVAISSGVKLLGARSPLDVLFFFALLLMILP
jgi:hypothetical protein